MKTTLTPRRLCSAVLGLLVDLAVEWLKVHREEIVTGTLVVIAGVAFVAAVGGSGGGLLFFVPLMAVASAAPVSELPADSRFAEVLNVNF